VRERRAEGYFLHGKKMKPILPSLREKKRYIMFKVISDKKTGFEEVEKAVHARSHEFMGELLLSKAGLSFLKDKWDQKSQTGIIRINHRYVDHLRAVFCLTNKIGRKKAMIRSLGTSGILKKTKRFKGG
jgi:ribonuclease P/MRP protein subunit POP5